MNEQYGLPIDVINNLTKEIRKHERYTSLASKKKELQKMRSYALALQVQQTMDDFEKKALERAVELYKKRVKSMVEVVTSMEKEDMNAMTVYSYAVIMLSDCLETFIIEMNQKVKKYYTEHKLHAYEELLQLAKESKKYISLVNGLGGKDKYHMNLYGDSVDNLREMIENKAKSFMNKINHHEESVNKKSRSDAEVA